MRYTDAELQVAVIKSLGRKPGGQRLAEIHEELFESYANDATTLEWNIARNQLNRALRNLRRARRIYFHSAGLGWRLV